MAVGRTRVTSCRRDAIAPWLLLFSCACGLGSQDSSSSLSRPLCDGYSGLPDGEGPTAGMVFLEGGRFRMGSNEHYPEERPEHDVELAGFWIGRHEVTNAQFARFIAETGYRAQNEREPLGVDPDPLAGGGAVFVQDRAIKYGPMAAWRWIEGSTWKRPHGSDSSIEEKWHHPVVQVSYEDALAYAEWRGHDLPTEAEWEFAAQGAAHDEANIWNGPFPDRNDEEDGFSRTSPVGCFPASPLGLVDLIGNVWEWTSDRYAPGHHRSRYDPRPVGAPARVIKGGSFLCADNYCQRYRPAARHAQDPTLSTDHLGFRTVFRP